MIITMIVEILRLIYDDHVLGVVIILEEHHNVELQKHAD